MPIVNRHRALYLYIIITAAILLPIPLWLVDLPFIFNTYGRPAELFELFTFFASAVLLTVAFIELRQQKTRPLIQLLPWLIPLYLAFHFLILLNEFPQPAWDYQCYQTAASAILQQTNPYTGCYLYPPLTAQVMAALYRVASTLLPPETLWPVLFYLYQVGQLAALGLAYTLCYRFGRQLNLNPLLTLLLVTSLFLLNNPLVRTLKHNQVNLWVLDLFLLAMLALERYPLIAGAAVALGGHLKLYPLILLLPWTLTRHWKAIFSAVLSFALILLTQWQHWPPFFIFSRTFPAGTYFRDNSLHSLTYNTLRFSSLPALLGRPIFLTAVTALTAVLSLLILIWLAVRYWQRETTYHQNSTPNANRFRLYGHSLDALALTLIIAPRVWEHHYVLAIPLMLWAAALSGPTRPWLVGLGSLLIAALPTFDIFPFSYHRLAGLFLLLYLAAPKRLEIGDWRFSNLQSPISNPQSPNSS